jgi:hypothetical protein
MKTPILLLTTIFIFACQNAQDESLEAEITNGLITAKLYLPDAENGYYRGSRFDWSGVIPELRYEGHDYFGQWFRDYDPKTHDAILGPVEEFMQIGYEEAPVNGEFMRIGIGGLRKPEENRFQRFGYYEFSNPGQWTVKKAKDHVVFTHKLNDVAGYSYNYQKTVRLVKGKAQMVLEHTLKNTGKKTIETNAYNHNFFMIDQLQIDSGTVVKFAFPVNETSPNPALRIEGQQMEYISPPLRSIQFSDLQGHSQSVKDYDFSIENRRTGAGVRITGDRPISKIVYWSSTTTQCPEPYMDITVQPGETFSWTITYDFYTFN